MLPQMVTRFGSRRFRDAAPVQATSPSSVPRQRETFFRERSLELKGLPSFAAATEGGGHGEPGERSRPYGLAVIGAKLRQHREGGKMKS